MDVSLDCKHGHCVCFLLGPTISLNQRLSGITIIIILISVLINKIILKRRNTQVAKDADKNWQKSGEEEGSLKMKLKKFLKKKDEIMTLILCEMHGNDGSVLAVQSDENFKDYQNHEKVMKGEKLFRHFCNNNSNAKEATRVDCYGNDFYLSEMSDADFILIEKS